MSDKYVSFKKLQESLNDLGIVKGDILYISSDMTLPLLIARRLDGISSKKDRDIWLGAFINCLQNLVGNEGTLLFPVYNWDFCKGKAFDILSTPGKTGSIGNWIMKNRQDFVRTKHPIYSMMVWGKGAGELVAMNNIDSWGKDSPFAYMHHHKGKEILLGIELKQAHTFMHYVEESVRVPYRYLKEFRAPYMDESGHTDERTYTMNVRDLGIFMQANQPEEYYIERNVLIGTMWYECPLKVVDLSAAYTVIKDNLLKGGGDFLYHFENYKLDWEKGATHPDEISGRIPGAFERNIS